MKAITNGRVVLPDGVIPHGFVEYDRGAIVSVGHGDYNGHAEEVTDAGGDYISPGFIDLHTHGAGDHDFMDCSAEAFLAAAEMHARHGATAIYPTTLASTNENLFEAMKAYEKAKPLNIKGSQFLGLHLEGPYFAFDQRGAQDPRYLRDPRPEEVEPLVAKAWRGESVVQSMTIDSWPVWRNA